LLIKSVATAQSIDTERLIATIDPRLYDPTYSQCNHRTTRAVFLVPTLPSLLFSINAQLAPPPPPPSRPDAVAPLVTPDAIKLGEEEDEYDENVDGDEVLMPLG